MHTYVHTYLVHSNTCWTLVLIRETRTMTSCAKYTSYLHLHVYLAHYVMIRLSRIYTKAQQGTPRYTKVHLGVDTRDTYDDIMRQIHVTTNDLQPDLQPLVSFCKMIYSQLWLFAAIIGCR